MSEAGALGWKRRIASWMMLGALSLGAMALAGASWGQTSAPPLPTLQKRFAWFGCDSVTVNGSTKLHGVPSVGGAAGFGGHVGSNGGILVNGSNTIDGNVTPGPGQTVQINGGQSQITGSTAPATESLPCEPVSVASWAAYAQANNSNASIPAKNLDKQGNFSLSGNKSCTLPGGVYYVGSFTVSGTGSLIVTAPAVFVVTQSLTINGGCKVNSTGDPGNLFLICSSSSPVTLNGSGTMSLTVYAPLSRITVNGSLKGTGNLWGQALTGNGSVQWNRVRSSAAPTLAVGEPADGSTVTQARPAVALTYEEEAGGAGLHLQSLAVTLDGVDITGSLTVTDTGATGTAPSALPDGAHTLLASISDYDGNSAHAQSTFTVGAAGDTTPPTITITGVTDGSWYNADVAAQVSVSDPHLDPASVTIALNGMPYASGTPVTADGYYVLSVSAADTFGNAAQAAVSFAVDKTPPGISVSSPADNGVVNATPVTLTGYIQDAHPEALTVNGSAVGSPGQSSFSAPVALTEGANVITLTATDRAGNSSSLAWHVTLKTTAPTVTVSVPLEGLVTRQTGVAVSGSVSADTVAVDVNGQPASVASGTFAAQNVPLVEGANTLTATARDAAGNAAVATVHVTRDTQSPVIAFTAPAEGTSTSASSITVSGTVTDASSVSATLNGSPLTLGDGSFSSTVPLVSGSNLLQVAATDAAGNSAQASRTVVREEGSLEVASISPGNGAQEISGASPVAVIFSRSVNKATVTASTFVVTAAGQAVTGAFVGEGSAITFLPASPFPDGAGVTVTLTGGIQDTAGNALTPFASSFTVLAGTGGPVGLALTLDAYPSLTNQTSVTISGQSSAGAAVTITGGSAPVTATAGTDGAFSASLPLAADALNAFATQASLSGQTSSSVPITIVQDGQAPSVLDCSLDGDTLVLNFSEAVAEATLTPANVTLSVNGTAATWSASLDGSGTRLLLTPDAAIGSNPVSLKLSTGVADLAGNGLAAAYTKAFQGATVGDAFLEGEVYNDLTGLPLAGVSVSLAGGGSSVTSGAMGSWALPAPEGEAVVHLSATGYSDAYRSALLTSGQIEAALDARLAPLSAEQRILPAAGGTGTFTSGVAVTAPEGVFPSDATATATALSGQALPLPLPAGFSPLAVWRLDITQTPSAALTLTLPRPSGTSGSLPAALFDASQQEWFGLAPAADSGSGLTVTLPASSPSPMTVVLLRLDTAPSEPSPVVEGQALSGVAATALQTATATLTTDPSTILPDQKATATVTITPPSADSSGAPFSVTFTESLQTTDGGTHAFSPYTADLLGYQDPSAPGNLKALFPVSPFPGIDVLTLLQGKIHLEVGPYAPGAVGGGIVGTSGGTVDGSGGARAELPSGAVTGSVPVQVLPVSQGSLLVPVPDGFAYVGGIELRLGGAELNSPAVLSLDEGSLAVPVASGDLVLLVEAQTVSGVAVLTAVDAAVLSGGRLATCSGAGYPAGLEGLPWPKVRGEGRYVFLKATVPTAFAAGKVTTGGTASPGCLVGRLTTESVNAASSSAHSVSRSLRAGVSRLVAQGKAPASALEALDLAGITMVSDGSGAYAIPLPLGASALKAVNPATADSGTAQVAPAQALQVVPQDIAIQAVPLTVVSTSPVDGAQGVPASSELYVTFSKLVAPASVTADHVAVTANGQGVSGSLRVVSGGTLVAFTPDEALPSGAGVTVTLQGITDRSGVALASAYSFSFTVASTGAPRLDPGKIEALLPNGSGQICVQGGPGAVEGLAVVYLVNTTHYEVGTATASAATDGSFSVCIQGAIGDRIELHVLVPGSSDRVYAFTQLVSADHQSVSMGPEGGIFTAQNADGTPLATVVVPAGAFAGAATIGLHPADASLAAPVPEGFTASSPLSIELSTAASKEIQLLLPAPNGWDVSDATKAFWLVRTIDVGGDAPRKAPMVADTLTASGCLGGSGSCLVTNSPPFPGLRESGLYQLYEVAKADWGFLTGGVEVSHSLSLLVSLDGFPFVSLTDASLGWTYVLPAPVSAGSLRESAGSFTLLVDDAQTWVQVLQQSLTSVTLTPGTPSDVGVVTDDHTPPFPLVASPIDVMAVQVKSLRADATSKIHYEVADSNGNGLPDANETVAVTGDPGAAPANTDLFLVDLSKPGSATLSATAGGDGAFSFGGIGLRGGDPGDILLLSIGQVEADPQAPLSVSFSRVLGGDFTNPDSYPIRIVKHGETTPMEGSPSLDSTRKVLTFLPASAWEAGATYEVSFPGLKDAAGDAFPEDFKADFTTSAGTTTTGIVANVGVFRAAAVRGSLLFVGTQQNGQEGIAAIDVSKPDAPVSRAFVTTTGVVRSLATADIDDPNHPGQLMPMLVAVGGGEAGMGFLSAYAISGSAPYLTFFGGNQLSCALSATSDDSNCQDAQGDSRNGEPVSVQVVGNYAYASVLGYGVAGVDLRTLTQTTQWPPVWKGDGSERIGSKVRMLALHAKTGHLIVPLGNGNLRVLAPDSADPTLVSDVGYGGYLCPQAGTAGCPCPGHFSTSGRLGLCLAEGWITYRKANAEAEPVANPGKDLAFLADGANGIAVFDVGYETSPAFYMRFGLADSGCGALDTFSAVSLNPRAGLLYAVGTAGLWVFDVAHLARMEAVGQAPVALPVRLVSHDPAYTGPEAPLIDPGTGMAYMGLSSDGVGAVKVSEPHVWFLSNQQAQSLTAVRRESVRALESDEAPVLDAVSADVDPGDPWAPRLAAFVPGGAGSTIAADVHSIARGGILRPAPAGHNPPTELAGSGARDDHKDAALVLHRQSDDPSDPKFNFYLSDPFSATFNMNKDAGSSAAPLILAADNITANLSVDSSQNSSLTWLSADERRAAGTVSPYIGIDFVDMNGDSVPLINPMSLELYQKALWKEQNPTQPPGIVTITNPVGIRLSIPQPLSDATVDSITATLYSHSDPTAQKQTYALTETDPATLEFKSGDGALDLTIITTLDPTVQPPTSPQFDASSPDLLSVRATGLYNGQPVDLDLPLVETGLDTRLFVDQTIEAHFVLGSQDLPSSQVNTLSGTLRDLAEHTLPVALNETGAGSRTFISNDGSVTFQLIQIWDEDGNPEAQPRPDSLDTFYGWLTVNPWGITNAPVVLHENIPDGSLYDNEVEPTKTVVNNGMGEPSQPDMTEISQHLIPQKKFYIEVHDPALGDSPSLDATYTDYTGATQSETLPLTKVDSLRARTALPMLSFDGPPFDATGYGNLSAARASASHTLDAAATPTIQGLWARRFHALAVSVKDHYQLSYGESTPVVSYVALGDSLTAGVNAGQQVYYNQVAAYPKRLADMLGLPMTLPLFDYPGIPASRQPNALRNPPTLDAKAPYLRSPHRINPDFLCTDLGVSGATVYETYNDKTMCGGSTGPSAYLFGGSLETAREQIVENYVPVRDGGIERHSPAEWLQKMVSPPSLLTVWIGANDALGVALDSRKVEGDDEDCKQPFCNGRANENLTTEPKFYEYYKGLVATIAKAYVDPNDSTKARQDLRPTLVFGLVPDVTVPPVLGKLEDPDQTKRGPNGGLLFHPFADSKFHPRVDAPGAGPVDLTNAYHDCLIELIGSTPGATASLQPDADGVYGRISAIPFAENYGKYLMRGLFGKKAYAKVIGTVFGTDTVPRTVVIDNPCADTQNLNLDLSVLQEDSDVRATSQRITAFNEDVLKVLFLETSWGDDGVKAVMDYWRKNGCIHVLDTHSMLTHLAQDSAPVNAPIPSNDPMIEQNKNLTELAGLAGIPPNDPSIQTLSDDQQAYTDAVDQVLPVTVIQTYLKTQGMQGVFGADLIHPTWTAHAAIANAIQAFLARLASGKQLQRVYSMPTTPTALGSATAIDVGVQAQHDPWNPKYQGPGSPMP